MEPLSVYLDERADATYIVFVVQGSERQIELQIAEAPDDARDACIEFLRAKYPSDWSEFVLAVEESSGGKGVWALYMNGPAPDPGALNAEHRRWTNARANG